MTTRTIPAQIIKTCDCCGAEMTPLTAREDGQLVLKRNALDLHGHAVADATQKWDLCDTCVHLAARTIAPFITKTIVTDGAELGKARAAASIGAKGGDKHAQ